MDRREFLQKAQAVGLALITPAISRALAAPIQPAEVRGHVVSGKKPLKGVCVSDGFRVVKTDPSGEFRLPVDPQSGPFLFVTTPEGFWTDHFYVPTATAVQKKCCFD